MIFATGQRLLFIGDSITDCGRTGPAAPYGDGYVSLLRALVTVRHAERDLTWINRGVAGDMMPGGIFALHRPFADEMVSALLSRVQFKWNDMSSHCGLSATSRTASAHDGSTTPTATHLSSWRSRSVPRSRSPR
jgi:hypothetical protein